MYLVLSSARANNRDIDIRSWPADLIFYNGPKTDNFELSVELRDGMGALVEHTAPLTFDLVYDGAEGASVKPRQQDGEDVTLLSVTQSWDNCLTSGRANITVRESTALYAVHCLYIYYLLHFTAVQDRRHFQAPWEQEILHPDSHGRS